MWWICDRSHEWKFTAASLANTLLDRNTKCTLIDFLRVLKNAELVAVDEVSFVSLHKDAAGLLFQMISNHFI